MSVRFMQNATTPWNINNSYDIGTVVKFDGNRYLSLKNVPSGVNIGMSDYWKLLDTEADISELQSDVADIKSDVSDIESDITGIENSVKYLFNDELGTGVTISEEEDFDVPNDGYVVVKSGNTAGDWYRVDIYGNSKTSNKRVAFKINSTTDGSSKYNLIPTFVKKGMVIRFTEKSTDNTTGSATYVPVVEE